MKNYTVSETELIDRANFFCKELFGLPFGLPVNFMENEPGIVVGGVFSHDYDSEGENIIDDYKGTTGTISINDCYRNNPLRLNNILLHELTHYKCWFTGLEHRDGDRDFEKELEKYHIISNYVIHYKKDGKTYDKDYHLPWMQKYEDSYQEHLKSNPQKPVKIYVTVAGDKELIGTATLQIKTGRISSMKFTHEKLIFDETDKKTPLTKPLSLKEVANRTNRVWVEFYGCTWELEES